MTHMTDALFGCGIDICITQVGGWWETGISVADHANLVL